MPVAYLPQLLFELLFGTAWLDFGEALGVKFAKLCQIKKKSASQVNAI